MPSVRSVNLAIAALLSLAGAATAQVTLVPTADNRSGSTFADNNIASFPDTVNNGYNIDPSEAYTRFINNQSFPSSDVAGGRSASANLTVTSRFLNVNSARSRATGMVFSSSGTASVNTTSGVGLTAQAGFQDQQSMGFRIDTLPTGGARFRFVGSVSAVTAPTTAQVVFRRGVTNIITLNPGQSTNQVIRLTQTGEYELRGTMSRNLSLAVTGTSSGSATMTGAFVCVADYDGNGARNIDDIFTFLSAWFANNVQSTDVDTSGSRTIDDIFIFLNLWFAGCD